MRKEFSLNHDKAMINFTAKYCNNFESLLESKGFEKVLKTYLERIKKRKNHNFQLLTDAFHTTDVKILCKDLTAAFRMLSMMDVAAIVSYSDKFATLLSQQEQIIALIEDFYSFWRKLDRYTIIHSNRIRSGIAAVSFTEANSNFSKLILDFYRTISKNVVGHMPSVYRQLSAGGNACIMLNNVIWPTPEAYDKLEDVSFIDKIILETPFITYPKKNTRDGMFAETFENPMSAAFIDKEKWFCYPAKVGSLLAFVYFHRDFMEHGITLCNLFELATEEEYKGIKPDMIYVFGAEEKEGEQLKTVFYEDQQNDIMFGYVNYNERIDYFGYMKKMILTLHNLIMIKRGGLPIHGAMVNIVLKNGSTANVVIVGDSGAGKSESIEAFRALSEEYVRDMTIVFDDMGVLKLDNNKILGYGTEIGAFVRLDDLDQGYAFKEIDRSIFMNPDKTNARLVMPVCSYKEITKGYAIDFFLYANNYEDVKAGTQAIRYFGEVNEAIQVFKDGARMAKGTTTENGLVKSYFANPFGPAQKQAECDILMDRYFKALYKSKVKVGQIHTCLGIPGMETEGPKNAALELFKAIREMKQ